MSTWSSYLPYWSDIILTDCSVDPILRININSHPSIPHYHRHTLSHTIIRPPLFSCQVLDEKSVRLKRLATKIDSERELDGELKEGLKVLESEGKKVKQNFDAFAQLNQLNQNFYLKAQQNHNVAGQILQQAVVILQRYAALLQEVSASSTGASGNPAAQEQFLAQTQGNNGAASAASTAVESFSQLQTKYGQLKEASDRAFSQAQLDQQLLQKVSGNIAETLTQAKNYRENLKLQQASLLDSDTEDANSLKRQADSVGSYVAKLRSACADILQHYDERRGRREANLNALNNAKNIISIDNADEIHAQLANLAGSVDAKAQQLVLGTGTSSAGVEAQRLNFAPNSGSGIAGTGTPGSSSRVPGLAAKRPAAAGLAQTGAIINLQHSLASNMLGDLQSLQSISSAEGSGLQSSAGLDMLPA